MKQSVTALIVEDGYILAVRRRADPTALGLPGGKVDPGETLTEAIIREVKEETGLDFAPRKMIFNRPCMGETDYDNSVFVGDWSGEVCPGLGEPDAVWVKPFQLLQGSFAEYNSQLFEYLITNAR